MVDFICCECKRRVSVVGPGFDEVPKPPLCAACLLMPGWIDDPVLLDHLWPLEGRQLKSGREVGGLLYLKRNFR
jgi:hypothetical protein